MFGIDHCFRYGFILFVLCCFYLLFRKTSPARIIKFAICYIYLVCVVAVTLFPLPVDPVTKGIFSELQYKFKPLRTVSSTLEEGLSFTAVKQLFGNVILFIPYGFSLGFKKRTIIGCLLFCMFFPLFIEGFQLCYGLLTGIYYRVVDIDDFLLNTIGAGIGILITTLLPHSYKERVSNYFSM